MKGLEKWFGQRKETFGWNHQKMLKGDQPWWVNPAILAT
jgi:hypothetical protein